MLPEQYMYLWTRFFLMFKFLPKTEITKQSAVCLFPEKKEYFIELFHNQVLLPLQCQTSQSARNQL